MRDANSYDTTNYTEIFRIFNRNDYGYYRNNIENIGSQMPSEDDASISLEQVYNGVLNN